MIPLISTCQISYLINFIINLSSNQSQISMTIKWKLLLIFLAILSLTAAKTQYNAQIVNQTSHSYVFKLTYTGSEEFYKKPTSPIIKELRFEFVVQSFEDFHFKITDWNQTRF